MVCFLTSFKRHLMVRSSLTIQHKASPLHPALYPYLDLFSIALIFSLSLSLFKIYFNRRLITLQHFLKSDILLIHDFLFIHFLG